MSKTRATFHEVSPESEKDSYDSCAPGCKCHHSTVMESDALDLQSKTCLNKRMNDTPSGTTA